ncbi:hypothetical protein FB567DRAFT_478254 [Paraphoma chrysanthemicola]|uniref:FAD-binding FR-type domain-containing protein n=1 Tax=Paraphoma chrysanthemicola TaxID=798071 RepID=A0A8K0VVC8_9PLEO|nr:hypothetical protein FB567DRAFT_478254 [Paraphoma chrysanthemicola]
MEHIHNAVLNAPTDLDDVRYEHHLKHRGRANHRIFGVVWLGMLGVLMIVLGHRMYCSSSHRFLRRHRYHLVHKRTNIRALNMAISNCRAIALLPLTGLWRRLTSTPSVGRFLVLAAYTLLITFLLVSVDAPLNSAHFLDDVAFRAAWLTLTQLPLVYLLATKRGPLNFIARLSHERISFVHRWVARTLFACATVHVVIMKSSITTSDIMHSNEQGMQVVRYGIGAYTMLVWIVVSSIMPLRRWSHRAFYVNHYISTICFLAIAFQHVPTYARPSIYLATSIIALDKALVGYFFIHNNVSLSQPLRRFTKFRRGPGRARLVMGYPIQYCAPSIAALSLPSQSKDATTVLRIANVPITWKPGQHVRVYVPALGRWEMHPFTPANCSVAQAPPLPPRKDIEHGVVGQPRRQTSDMLLLIKAKSGLTERLADHHRQWLSTPCPNATHPPPEELTAYIDGPYGSSPTWRSYDNLVLVATSTGVSFTLSILDHLEQQAFLGADDIRTRHIHFIWIVRHVDPAFETSVTEVLARYAITFREANIHLAVTMYTTCSSSLIERAPQPDVFAHLRPRLVQRISDKPALRIRHPDEIVEEWNLEAAQATEETDPFIGWDEYASPDSDQSEDGTLVNAQEPEGEYEEEKNEDEARWMDDVEDEDDEQTDRDERSRHDLSSTHDDAWRPNPPPQTDVSQERDPTEEGCQCALIQHQRRKLQHKSDIATHVYGARPDLGQILSTLADDGSCMVAVCANDRVARDVRGEVSRMTIAHARGKRRGKVDVWIENQE